MTTDTKVSRRSPYRPVKVRPKGRDSPKSPDRWDKRSRHRALEHLRNATCYRFFITLTMPMPVSDDRFTKRALERVGLWLVRRGVSFFWKVEFRADKPHLHLLATKEVSKDELAVAWADAIGQPYAVVDIGPIRDVRRVVEYLCKSVSDDQNQVPKGYRNMGRFWGTRGPEAKPDLLLKVKGDAASIAKALRPLKKLEALKKGAKRRDQGRVGMTLYDIGGEAVADATRKALGIEEAGNET